MNVSERAPRVQAAHGIDLDRFRLRRFVESLAPDQLETRSAPVDLADVAAVFEGNDKAVWFSAVGPERQELVGNVRPWRRQNLESRCRSRIRSRRASSRARTRSRAASSSREGT